MTRKPIGRIVGAEAMKLGGWQRLNAEYANQLGVETPRSAAERPETLKRENAWGWAAATSVLWGLSYFFWRRLQATPASA